MIPTNPKQFLAQHIGLKFDTCYGKFRTKWSNSSYSSKQYDPRINMCQLNHDELILEGDADPSVNILNLSLIREWLLKNKIYFMITSHKGKSPYIWLKLTTNDNRVLTELERKEVIMFFSIFACLDEALAYLNFVRPIPNTYHWKHNKIEKVIEVNQGNALNIDSLGLNLKKEKRKNKERKIVYDKDIAQGLAKKIQLSNLFNKYDYHSCPMCQADEFYLSINDNKGCMYCNHCGKGLGIKGLIQLKINNDLRQK